MQLLVTMPSPWRFVRFKCSLSRFTRNCCKHSCIKCIKSPMKYTLLASDTKYVAWMTPQRAINIWHIEISIRPDNLNFTSYLVSIFKKLPHWYKLRNVATLVNYLKVLNLFENFFLLIPKLPYVSRLTMFIVNTKRRLFVYITVDWFASSFEEWFKFFLFFLSALVTGSCFIHVTFLLSAY